MKLSYAVSLQKTGFNFIAQEDWVNKAKVLSYLGYDGIELSIRDPRQIKITNIEMVLSRYALKLAAIGTGQIFNDDGLSLSSSKKNIRQKAIKRIKSNIDIAKAFDSLVIIGLARGKSNGIQDRNDSYRKSLLESFRQLCDYASKRNVTIAIEPINRYEVSFLNNVGEAVRFISEVKCSCLRILLDTFHMNIEEKDFIAPISQAGRLVSYVHLSDNNRLCPGRGHIDFKEIISALKKIKYKGYLSAEILPMPSFKSCAKEFHNYVERLI